MIRFYIYEVITLDPSFAYTINFNISTNANKILNLVKDDIKSGTKLLEEGASLYQFYMREWAGVNPEDGLPMWYVNVQSDDDENTEKFLPLPVACQAFP